MKNLINTITATASNAVLFAAAIAMAALGFVTLGTLAIFAFIALGLALLAAPFVGLSDGIYDAEPADDSTV